MASSDDHSAGNDSRVAPVICRMIAADAVSPRICARTATTSGTLVAGPCAMSLLCRDGPPGRIARDRPVGSCVAQWRQAPVTPVRRPDGVELDGPMQEWPD